MNPTTDILPAVDTLTAAQMERINENSYLVKHKKGEHIFRNEQPISHLMFLQSGLVKLYKDLGSEKSLIIKIVGPESYVGIIAAFYSNRYNLSAAALEDCEIIYLSLPVFKEILGENGLYALYMLNEMSKQGVFLIEKMVNLSHKQIPGRIAEILLFFLGRYICRTVSRFRYPGRSWPIWYLPPKKASAGPSLNSKTTD